METIHPLLFLPLLYIVCFLIFILFSLSLYFTVIASSYGNLPENVFYMFRVLFCLSFSL